MANYDLDYEGSVVQDILDTGKSLEDDGYIYLGTATPSTIPGTPTERVAYVGGPGTYNNFGTTVVVPSGSIVVITYSGSAWSKTVINASLPVSTTLGSDNTTIPTSKAVKDVTDAINNKLGEGYLYAGIATAATNPGTPTVKVFYLARQAGTYTNFGGLTLTEGVNILKYNGTAWSQEQLISIADIYKNPLMGYYECDTAGGTAAKTVAATGYVLPATGGSVKIKMASRNTVANATLNINSTGAKPLFYNGVMAGVGNTWDTNEIVEVFYDGTNYQAYNVAGSNGDGVFDISAYNLTDGQPTPYVDLEAALGTNGANVPESVRKGGMSVKFIQGSVQSSDNKYVQYRLTSDTFTTTVSEWQKQDIHFVNVNDLDNHSDAYSSKTDARNAVPSFLRKSGMTITYKISSGWLIEQYIGNNPSSSGWGSDDSQWLVIITNYTEGLLNAKIDKYNTVVNASYLSSDQLTFAGIGEAAEYIDTNCPELKKRGCIVTFYNGSKWLIYQTRNTDNEITSANWKNIDRWIPISNPTRVVVPVSKGIAGINSVLWDNPTGVVIELEEGTYTGSSAVSFWNGSAAICSNCVIIGKGSKTIISRTSGNDVLDSSASSANNIIKNLTLQHGVQREKTRLHIYQCIVGGKYIDDSMSSPYDIKIAASNSSNQAKSGADVICSGSGDDAVINSAISAIQSTGGTIFLAAGTYTLSNYVNLNDKSNICIKGSGKNTVLTRASGYAIFSNTNTTNCCISELSANNVNLSNGNFMYNVWIGGEYKPTSPTVERVVNIMPEKGIAGINDAIDAMPAEGGTIKLSKGTYTGSNPIRFYKSSSPAGYKNNIRIVGEGKCTVIQRTGGSFDMIATNVAVSGNYVENVAFAQNVQRTGGISPSEQIKLIKCFIAGVYVDESNEDSPNVINIGEGRFFSKLTTAMDMFYATGILPSKRWELHVYGHITETGIVGISKNYIDIIGHNAVIELKSSSDAHYFSFLDQEGDTYGPGLYIRVRNIHFLRTGCGDYWDNACVMVSSNCVTFEDCIFENATTNPYPFDQSDYGVGYEDHHGGRRHGIEVNCSKYGIDCKTTFKNCVAIGSPYGTNSSRGWYLLFGSPKLYNCIGYGGGYGEFGHGILSHRASRAELFNCIGYASANSYRQAAGIRFQACGSSQLNGCIGYPSYGTKKISNGVKATAISRICTELSLNVDDYVNEGVVDFAAVSANSSMLAKIEQADIDIVAVAESTNESYGISFWENSGISRLLNCKSYIGSGQNSRALHIINKAEPTILGGYFGVEDIMTNKSFVKDSGQNYMTYLPVSNAYVGYKICKIAATLVGYTPSSGDKLYVETVESTPQMVVNGFDMTGLTSIVNPSFTETEVPAGVNIKVYVKNGDTMKSLTNDSLLMHLAYNYMAENSSALYIDNDADPIVKGSILRNVADAIKVGTGVTNIKVFDCLVEGTVAQDITFAQKTAINGSSNYSI